jgi:peroxiredoxin/drug/metabolite transporter (DMT)-like permease
MPGWPFGALSVLLFSTFTLVSRLGVASSLTMWDLAALRFGIGATLLAPVLVRRGLSGVAPRDAATLALTGGLGFALLAYGGFALAPAAHGAVLLHGTLPLTTLALLGLGGRGGRPGYRRAGVALVAAGVGLMAYDSLARATGRQLAGDGLLVLASCAWSAYGITARRLGLRPAHGVAIVTACSACAYLPVYAALHGWALLAAEPRDLLLQAAVQGALIGGVSVFVYTRAVAALGPATAALFTASVPCLTTLGGALFLGERPGVAPLIGVGVVTAGMLVTAWPRDSSTRGIRVMRVTGVVERARRFYEEPMTTHTLRDRIDAFNRELEKQAPAEAVQAIGAAIGELVRAGVGAGAPKVGQLAPGFTLPDALGRPVTLAKLLEAGPVVLAFYRGQWCPYCDLQLRAYQQALPEIAALGARLVAISPQTPDESLSTAEKRGLAFDVLSDRGNAVARAYGLVWKVTGELDRVQRGFGIDLARANGDGANELPAPGLFVIDRDGRITFARVDANWTTRVEPTTIVRALAELSRDAG